MIIAMDTRCTLTTDTMTITLASYYITNKKVYIKTLILCPGVVEQVGFAPHSPHPRLSQSPLSHPSRAPKKVQDAQSGWRAG